MLWKRKKTTDAAPPVGEKPEDAVRAHANADGAEHANSLENINDETGNVTQSAAAETAENAAPDAQVTEPAASAAAKADLAGADDNAASNDAPTAEGEAPAEETPKEADPDSFIYKVIKYSEENGAGTESPKKRKKRTALTVTLIVLAFVCVVGASALLLFHDIYSKLNYDAGPTEAEMNAAIDRWKDAEASGLLDEDEEDYTIDGQPEEPVDVVDPGMDFSTIDVAEYPDSEALLAYSQELQAEADDLQAQADAKQQEADDYATLAQMRLEYEEEQARLEEERIKEEIRATMAAEGTEPITDENVINIMLIGTDTRDINNLYSRSDTMILLSVNKETKEIILTSFMRDSYVYISGADTYNRLNAANAIGGPTLLCRTMGSVFGIDVDKYVSVNFFSFIDIVDAMGGVDIEVTEEEIGHLNDNLVHQNWVRGYEDEMDFVEHGTAGMMHLNGNQALAYARIRYLGGDTGRTARQRQVISLLIDKVRDMTIPEIYDLFEVVLPLIRTNLTEGECLSVLLDAGEYLDYTVKSLRIPYDGAYKYASIKGMSVLEIDIDKCRRYLRNQIYG